MPILVVCTGCDAKLKAPDNAAGKKIKCPKCATPLTVQAPEPSPVEEDEAIEEEVEERPKKGAVVLKSKAKGDDEEVAEGDKGEGFPEPPEDWKNNRTTVAILAIVIGCLGIHKFMLGLTKPAIITIAVTVVGSCIGIGPVAMAVVGIIEGIKYLQMSDAEFYQTYVVGKKEWF